MPPSPCLTLALAFLTEKIAATKLYLVYESVMKPKLCDEKGVLFEFVNNPVFLIYSSGPITGQSMLERFWFSFSFIWRSFYVFYKVIDSFEYARVGFLPVEIILPRLSRKNNLQSIRSFSVPLPSSSSLIDSNSRRALRGLLRR